MVYFPVQYVAKELKFLHKLDKTTKNFVSIFVMNSIYIVKIITIMQKKSFSCTLRWFLEHIFESRKNFPILFLSGKNRKNYKNDVILSKEYIIFKRNNMH